MAWWNTNFKFKRVVTVDPVFGDITPQDKIAFPFNKTDMLALRKVRNDNLDLYVIYENYFTATPTFTSLARTVVGELVYFAPVKNIEEGIISKGEYYVYYGNKNLVGAPALPVFDGDLWSNKMYYNSPGISVTRPGDHWVQGVSLVPNAIASASFYSDRIRIVSNAGLDKGIASISIDDAEWIEVDLYSNISQEKIIYEVSNLTKTNHSIRLKVTGGSNPSSSGTEVNFVRFETINMGNVTNDGEEVNPNIIWGTNYVGGV